MELDASPGPADAIHSPKPEDITQANDPEGITYVIQIEYAATPLMHFYFKLCQFYNFLGKNNPPDVAQGLQLLPR